MTNSRLPKEGRGTVRVVSLATFLALTAVSEQASALIIDAFRVRGPSGPSDEFIQVYNETASAHTVTAASGTGYGIAASDGTTRCSIPDGTVIPAHGHWLCVNSVSYSLSGYPAGNGATATGDATYSTDIPDNAGIALFNNNTGGGSYTFANRLDAVGSTSEANTLYKEGTGYPELTPFSIDYGFVRDVCGKGGAVNDVTPCTTSLPIDTNNNATDFYFVDTNGTSAGAGQRLGAPGPQNLSSPIYLQDSLDFDALDTCTSDTPPNTVRDFTSDPANNSTFGTNDVRLTFTNNTGAPITRLRFRIVDIDTFPAASGYADLRPRTSTDVIVTVDRPPCGSGTSNVTVYGTTLEQPPSQPNGGGFNSTFSVPVVTAGTPLANGASIDVRFLFGIQQTGAVRLALQAETLPAGGVMIQLMEGSQLDTMLTLLNLAPTASAVTFAGTAQLGQMLTGSYTYADAESDPQDTSGTGTSYRVVRSTDNDVTTAGDNVVAGSGTTGGGTVGYTVQAADQGNYLFYCVTPEATSGVLVGVEACSAGALVAANVAPTASAVTLTGTAQLGQVVTGNYTYGDADGDPQDTSGTGTSYRLVRSTDNDVTTAGDNTVAASGTTAGAGVNYTVQAADQGNYLFYCVTPEATSGVLVGTEVCSSGALVATNVAPTAAGVTITGTAQVGQVVAGNYTYGDANGDPQDTSGTGTSYRLVRSTDNDVTTAGDNVAAASGTTGGSSVNYTVQAADQGNYLFYCVTPKATSGVLVGAEFCSGATLVTAGAPIPTLSQWGMILLSGLLGIFGVRQARKGS